MKTSAKKKPVRARSVPENACPSCGSLMKEAAATLKVPVNGESVAVAFAKHLRCPKCGEIVLRLRDAKRLQEDAVALYRRKNGLLAADEIRAVRERYGLTQSELAKLLRLGGNTVSRWESGRNAQSAAMDVLLRLIRDLPGSIAYLRKHAA